MSANAYEVLALAMRYVFAGLMLLIVLRGWRTAVVDSRRARKLRRLSPDTGVVGELLVLDGNERARRGMRYPVTLEGTIGSARRSDIRIRHSSVKARHAIYQMTNEGLYVRGHAGARIGDAVGQSLRELKLSDGDVLRIGRVRLLLVLTGADASPEEMVRRVARPYGEEDRLQKENEMDDDLFAPRDDTDDLFASDPDDLFASNPAGSFGSNSGGDFDAWQEAPRPIRRRPVDNAGKGKKRR